MDPAIHETGETVSILLQDVDIFDGVNEKRVTGAWVLIKDDLISQISESPIEEQGATVIDGEGRTLMPGIIDAHVHLTLLVALPDLLNELPSYRRIMSAVQAEKMLMRGVTTARDAAGEVFSLKRSIDEGLVVGPRIYPSGPMIVQTSGHGDFRTRAMKNPNLGGHRAPFEEAGDSMIVDGPSMTRSAVREALRLGASQVKLAIGGGVSSPSDPIDVTEFSQEEIEAAVAAAEDFGTYVMVHGYTPRAINRAIDAGVKSIEHGHLLDVATLERMADEGVWLSFQPFTESHEDWMTPLQNEKQAQVSQGTAFIYEQIKKMMPKLKVAHGTDVYLDPDGNDGQVKQMERLLTWMEPIDILRMATSNAGELLKMSGPRDPYPHEMGVVKEGAYADLLLVDGNPLKDLTAVTDSENLRIIMKGGTIHKNTLR